MCPGVDPPMLFRSFHIRGQMVAVLFVCTACGDGAVPGATPPDASLPVPVDASLDAAPPCSCLAAEVLSSDRILHDYRRFPTAPGQLYGCLRDEYLIAGGCIVDELTSSLRLREHGFNESTSIESRGWRCFFNGGFSWEDMRHTTATAVCLADPLPTPPLPPNCECLPVEPLEDRFVNAQQTGTIPGGTVARVTASCQAETTLLAGSCSLAFEMSGANDSADLVSAGFSNDVDGEPLWECVWINHGTASVSPIVTVTCLRPPKPDTAPEAVPFADLVVKVEQRDTVPAGTLFTHQVACAEGELLLHGGCTLEDAESAPSDLSIFRAGFLREEDGDDDTLPNTWQCGWNNPSTSTPTAIATALCIKPVPAP